jgi:hypothetical protein
VPPFRVANPTRPWALLPLEPLLDEELELLELEELVEPVVELDELELLELEDDELELDEVEPVVELDELEELEDEELEELVLLELVEPPVPPLGIEHSFTPPATRVPAPKVASEQTKLPLKILNVKRSARPKATLVLAATVQVLFSVQMVT